MYCLFDLDGTLMDSERVWEASLQYAMACKGVRLSWQEVVELECGRSWEAIFADIQVRWPGLFRSREEAEQYTVPYYQRVVATEDISIPASVNLLRQLFAAGHCIAIVSGSTRARVRDGIAQLKLQDCISDYVGCEDYSASKPAPDSFLRMAERLGARPEECVVFEDASVGVTAAKAAGMKCVALDNGIGQVFMGADRVLRSMDEVTVKDIEAL